MTVLPGLCAAHHATSPAVCTLPAGHPGPHQAEGYGQRVLEEWAPAVATETGAA